MGEGDTTLAGALFEDGAGVAFVRAPMEGRHATFVPVAAPGSEAAVTICRAVASGWRRVRDETVDSERGERREGRGFAP